MGIDIVIRNCEGELVAMLCNSVKHVASSKILEIHALWRAIKLCAKIGLYELIFKGNAKTMIEEVNSIVSS